jgi:hypothetical protein
MRSRGIALLGLKRRRMQLVGAYRDVERQIGRWTSAVA